MTFKPDKCEQCVEGETLVASDYEGEPWRSLWLAAEAKDPSPDGWHSVKCPFCTHDTSVVIERVTH